MTNEFTDDQRKHLEFLQAAVVRMAGSSSSTKSLAVTVGLAAFGVARFTLIPELSFAGVMAVLLLGLQDARYLRLERQFREVYDRARLKSVELYDMSLSGPPMRLLSVIWSWSISGFYGALILVGVVAAASAVLH